VSSGRIEAPEKGEHVLNTIIALWYVPRSLSTAFERMMMQRGDFKFFHEPFYLFYLKERASTALDLKPDLDHPVDFPEILAMIRSAVLEGPVFFKDMPCCVISRTDKDFLSIFENTSIIRDPAKTLVSYYRLDPNFTIVEASYAEQRKMFELVMDITGKVPALVDAEDLVENPYGVVKGYCERVGIPFMSEALTWEAVLKPEWKRWEVWHLDVAESTGFIKDMEAYDISVHDVPRLSEMYELCMPHYEAIYQKSATGQ